jgi:hypothetical protein
MGLVQAFYLLPTLRAAMSAFFTAALRKRRACMAAITLAAFAWNSQTSALTPAQQAKLQTYATTCVRYFTSDAANNRNVGFTHAFFGTGGAGAWRVWNSNTSAYEYPAGNMPRGYGSHVNINEITLRFVVLAAAYKSGWLNHLAAASRYPESWGQIKLGLETLRALQTSGQASKIKDGTFHRAYLTAITHPGGPSDVNRLQAEIAFDGQDRQSSDDSALGYMNLLVLQGFAADTSVSIPPADRAAIVSLCQQVRDAMNLRRFYEKNWSLAPLFPTARDLIVMDILDGEPSLAPRSDVATSIAVWDRWAAEGVPIIAAMLISGSISVEEFERIVEDSLINTEVDWHTGSAVIPIAQATYHGAMFMHLLRSIHGLPVTPAEHSGASFFTESTLPVFRAHQAYADVHSFSALGTQAMTQELNHYPLFTAWSGAAEFDGALYHLRYPGNESDLMPTTAFTGANARARSTAPHGLFVPLSRASLLTGTEADWLFARLATYESSFFHSGAGELGWEAVIPWTSGDTSPQSSWVGGSRRNFCDWGRPYEALNSAYIVLSIFDALNPSQPLASYNVAADKARAIASFFDSDTPLPREVIETDPRMRAAITTNVRSGNDTHLTWGTYPDESYTVQYSETLEGGSWIDLVTITGPAFPATTASHIDLARAPANGRGFYRIKWHSP